MFYDRLVALAKEKKKSINQVEIDLGFSKNTLYNTKKYTPQGDKLAKLADYFEVSTDYLLEKTDIKTTVLTGTNGFLLAVNQFLNMIKIKSRKFLEIA